MASCERRRICWVFSSALMADTPNFGIGLAFSTQETVMPIGGRVRSSYLGYMPAPFGCKEARQFTLDKIEKRCDY